MPTIPYKNAVGQRIPGVTTILSGNLGWNKQALMWWANEQGLAGKKHTDVSDAAADAGTLAHKMVEAWIRRIECHLDGATPETVQLAQTAFGGFLTWARHSRLEVVATEVHLVSEAHQFGATPDAIGLIDGELCLLDWKATGATYAEHMAQLAAYYEAWEEVTAWPLRGGIHLCRFDKASGGFTHKWVSRPPLEPAWQAFLHARALHALKGAVERLAK